MQIQPISFPVTGLGGELAMTLAEVVRVSAGLRDPWWIIGSAALAMTGLPGVVVPDVDLVTSRRDAERLIRRWADSAEPPPAVPSTKFRSEFRRFTHAPLPIEVMGDFDVWTGADWHPIRPRTRVPVACGAGTVYVASADEQVEILRRIGRPKDLVRAKALEAYRGTAAGGAASIAVGCPASLPAGAGWAGGTVVVPELLGMPMADGACLLSA